MERMQFLYNLPRGTYVQLSPVHPKMLSTLFS
jgi:hypothetical protein